MANSSVLISLSAIQQLDLLHQRFAEILIPQAVWQEVVVEGKGQPGAQEVQSAGWIKVEKVKSQAIVQLLLASLERGESEAIALAREVGWLHSQSAGTTRCLTGEGEVQAQQWTLSPSSEICIGKQ